MEPQFDNNFRDFPLALLSRAVRKSLIRMEIGRMEEKIIKPIKKAVIPERYIIDSSV